MSSTSFNGPPPVIRAFLSHSYGAPEVNHFFYDLNQAIATITFRVDRGTFSTSTTRLERMIRDADAFVGVWPVPGEPGADWNQADLAHQSRYFQLELDMAIRARKPGIVFVDRRYGTILPVPSEIVRLDYDAQEIPLGTNAPAWPRLRSRVERFWSDLRPQLDGRPLDPPFHEGRVGVVFGRDAGAGAVRAAEETIAGCGLDPVVLPATLSLACLSRLRRCDWVVADVTDPAIEAMTAFLYGQFVPVLRTRRQPGPAAASATEEVLFGDLSVGYCKDVTFWSTESELSDGLSEQLAVVKQQAELIGDERAAIDYFTSAAKRKDPVFLSYAAEDADTAEQFAVALRRRFQKVFNYHDPEAMRIGKPWQEQLAHKLSATAIGVILLSKHYAASAYCQDESFQLKDNVLQGRAELLLVRLDDADVPAHLAQIQYARVSQETPAEIVERFIRELGSA